MASTAGVRALKEHYVYCMTKAALIMATKVLALELGPSGVRANPSAHGHADRDGSAGLAGPPGQVGADARRIPLRRFVYPGEVSELAVWLASDAASVINGVELPVDGGLLVT